VTLELGARNVKIHALPAANLKLMNVLRILAVAWVVACPNTGIQNVLRNVLKVAKTLILITETVTLITDNVIVKRVTIILSVLVFVVQNVKIKIAGLVDPRSVTVNQVVKATNSSEKGARTNVL